MVVVFEAQSFVHLRPVLAAKKAMLREALKQVVVSDHRALLHVVIQLLVLNAHHVLLTVPLKCVSRENLP